MVRGPCCSAPLTLQTLLNYENVSKIQQFYKKMPKQNPQNTLLINKALYKTQHLHRRLQKTLRHTDIFHVKSGEMSGIKVNGQSP